MHEEHSQHSIRKSSVPSSAMQACAAGSSWLRPKLQNNEHSICLGGIPSEQMILYYTRATPGNVDGGVYGVRHLRIHIPRVGLGK